MSNAIVNTLAYVKSEYLTDADGVAVTTKVTGDWTKAATLLGVGTTVTPTITHRANGYYDVSFTPTVVGNWSVEYSVVVDGETVPFDPQLVQVVTAAQADPAAALAGASVELVSPLSADGGTLRLIQGDSYAAAQSRSLSWTLTGQPDLTTATVTLTIVVKGVTVEKAPLSGTSLASGSPTITATLTKLETAGFDPAIGVFDLSAAIGSDEITLVRGRVYVEADV